VAQVPTPRWSGGFNYELPRAVGSTTRCLPTVQYSARSIRRQVSKISSRDHFDCDFKISFISRRHCCRRQDAPAGGRASGAFGADEMPVCFPVSSRKCAGFAQGAAFDILATAPTAGSKRDLIAGYEKDGRTSCRCWSPLTLDTAIEILSRQTAIRGYGR